MDKLVTLLRKLAEFGILHATWDNQDRLPPIYFGDTPPYAGDDAEALAFMEWLHLDAPAGEGMTCAEQFRARHAARLDDGERRLLDALIASHLGLYEVTAVRPGGFTVRHLLFDTMHDVVDRTGAVAANRGDVFAARLFENGDHLEPCGGVMSFKPAHKTALIERVCDELADGPLDVRALKLGAGIFQRCHYAIRQVAPPKPAAYATGEWQVMHAAPVAH